MTRVGVHAGDPPEVAVVRALVRALRAAGYYEPRHLAVRETLREAQLGLAQGLPAGTRLELAGVGSGLLFDVDAPAREDEVARALAQVLFDRSIVALALEPGAEAADLASLIGVLSAAPDALRAQGGARAALSASGARGVEVVEVDFAAVFSGQALRYSAAEHPLVQRALREVLRFREGRAVGAGEALGIRFDALVDVDALDGVLDQLIESADASLRANAAERPRARRGKVPEGARITTGRALALDDVADLGAEAYLANQAALEGEGEATLARSAEALADALARLSPDARFALIRRLAGGEALDGGAEAAVERLGRALDGRLLVDALAQALAVEREDSEVVRAIGRVLRRLHPVEQERVAILDAVDRQLGARGAPLGGAVWQELQARALDQEGRGLLAIAPPERVEKLARFGQARVAAKLPRVAGDENLLGPDEAARARGLAAVVGAALRDPRALGPALRDRVAALVDALERDGREREATRVLALVLERGERHADTAAEALLAQLLEGPRGAARSPRLVRAVKGGRSRLVAELLVRAADEVGEAEQRAELVDRLARCDVAALEAIAEAAQPGTAARAGLLLDAARRADPRLVVQLARHTLRYPGSRARELTLRRVGASGTPAAVALLAAVAGAKGDDAARRLLGIDPERDARALEDTQALAVAVLGGTRHADAIAPLAALLGRSTLLPDKHVELLRVEAARALAALGLPDARRLLEQALEHKKKAIRDAAERALSGRPTSIPPS